MGSSSVRVVSPLGSQHHLATFKAQAGGLLDFAFGSLDLADVLLEPTHLAGRGRFVSRDYDLRAGSHHVVFIGGKRDLSSSHPSTIARSEWPERARDGNGAGISRAHMRLN